MFIHVFILVSTGTLNNPMDYLNITTRCYRVRDYITCCECHEFAWTCAVNYTCPITPVHYANYSWLVSLLLIGTLILLFIFINNNTRNRRMYDEVGVDALHHERHSNVTISILRSVRRVLWPSRNRPANEIPLTSFDSVNLG